MPPALRYRLLLLAAAVLFSTGGAAIKAASLNGWQVASFRSAVAAAALLLLEPAARGRQRWEAVAVGATYAATMILFALANKLTTAANAIFLQDTAPLYLLALGPLLLHEPVRRRDFAFLAVMVCGMTLFFAAQEAPSRTAPDPFRGNLLAVSSGITWASTIAGLRWLGTRCGAGAAAPAVVAGNLIAFLGCLPMAVPVTDIGWRDLAVLLYLGVFQIALAYWCLTRGLARVPALEASLLLLAEPALNPVWAWLLHGERPSAWALVGGALILTACLLKTWSEQRPGSAG